MSLDCFHARQRIQARAAGLSEADRLRLESHTSTCAACSMESHALERLVQLAHTASPQLNDATRQRVIAAALSQVERDHEVAAREQVAVAPHWAWRASLGGVAAVGLSVAALLLFAGLPTTSDEVDTTTTVQSFRADGPRDVVLDGATLTLETGTALDWDAQHAHVTLRAGRVRARVKARNGKPPFVVIAPEFRVVVVGTDFDVAMDAVVVHEGVVRIEASKGEVLHPGLRAGERWVWLPDAVTDKVADDAVEPTTVAAHGSTKTPQPMRTAAREVTSQKPSLTAEQWLAQARRRLSQGDVTGARVAVAQAERLPGARLERAEAATLLAECFQVEGKLRPAIAQYQSVARAYSDLGAGDNAAYAASRLTLMRGDRGAAAVMFRRYLNEHSDGRFRDEAQRALSQLEVNQSHDGASNR